MSYIITKYDKDTTMETNIKLKHIIYDLYHKYIKIGSQFEININHNIRSNLIGLIHNKSILLQTNMTNDELTHIFFKSCQEMYKLMGYSISRANKKNDIIKSLNVV